MKIIKKDIIKIGLLQTKINLQQPFKYFFYFILNCKNKIKMNNQLLENNYLLKYAKTRFVKAFTLVLSSSSSQYNFG